MPRDSPGHEHRRGNDRPDSDFYGAINCWAVFEEFRYQNIVVGSKVSAGLSDSSGQSDSFSFCGICC